MDPETSEKEHLTLKRHSRNISHNRILLRRSTKGPLDVDDPLTPKIASKSTQEFHHEPPVPASADSPPATPHQKLEHTRDLSFLLHPSIYHNLPPSLFPPSSPPVPSSPSTLFSSRNYHLAATLSAQRLTKPPPPSQAELLNLVYIRLASLVQLNHTTLAIEESKPLGDVNAPFYVAETTYSCILPWELRILALQLQSLAGAAGRGGVEAWYELAKDARVQYTRCDRQEKRQMWRERLKDVGWKTVDALVEEGDMVGALRQTKGLKVEMDEAEWAERMLRLYLKCGDVGAAERIVESMQDKGGRKRLCEALVKICAGDYTGAGEILRGIDKEVGAKNNLAVMKLYTGAVGHCVKLLDEMVAGGDASKETVFNLATCFELLAERGVKQKKDGLVAKVKDDLEGKEGILGPVDFKL